MGLLSAIGGGLAEAGGAVAKIGMAQIQSAIEEERAQRLAEFSSKMRLDEDETKRTREEAARETERDRKSAYMNPTVSNPNGLLSENAGLSEVTPGADENVGVDVQNRSRPATYKQGAQNAAKDGDFETAKILEGLDNSDEKLKNAQVLAEMRQRYNTDKLTQQGQLAMMKLAASIAKGGSGSSKESDLVQDLKYLKELEPSATVDQLKETYAQLKRGVAPRTETTEKNGVMGTETETKRITPGASLKDKVENPKPNRSSQFKVIR